MTTDRRLARLLPVSQWPRADEARRARWFQPVTLGPLTARTRTWVPAMVPWRATPEGGVTPAVLDWYRRFAQGRPGVIVVEATGIRDVPSGPLLRASHDRFIDGLRRLTDTVREASAGQTRLFIQLIDFLAIKRRPPKEKYFAQHLGLTERHRAACPGGDDAAVRARLAVATDDELRRHLTPREFVAYARGYREQVTDTHLPHIAELPRVLPELFAQAARRCDAAGFDGVELHFAHAYTLASFLSATNTRADGYGGSPQGRLRLPLEVIAAVQQALGKNRVLGCRFLADEIISGGSGVDDAAAFGVAFARAGLHFLSLSRGGKFEDAKQPKVGHAAYPYTGPSGHECMPTPLIGGDGPWGRNLGAVAAVKRAVVGAGFSTPVVACGGISTFDQAEAVLARGDADIVASARQSLADPDWFLKLEAGRGEDIRRCLFTNYCEGLDQSHEVVTCQRWDRVRGEADDATVPRTSDGRRTVAPAYTLPSPLS